MKDRTCTLAERIQEIVATHYHNSARAFATKLGIAPNSVLSYMNVERPVYPSYQVIEAIVKDAGVNPDWLLAGNGPMMQSERDCAADGAASLYPGDGRQAYGSIDEHANHEGRAEETCGNGMHVISDDSELVASLRDHIASLREALHELKDDKLRLLGHIRTYAERLDVCRRELAKARGEQYVEPNDE